MKRSRLRRLIRLRANRNWRFLRRSRVAFTAAASILVLLTLTSRLLVAYYLANDAPGDGVVYARLAKNLLEQGVYSIEEQAPYSPTLIRMPGYPLFIAGVYSIFGHDNSTAVRIVQAFVDTATCVLAAIIAWIWCSGGRKRRAAFWTFIAASLCPFIVIYSALILTETLTTFLMAAMVLGATLAIRTQSGVRSTMLWFVTGVLGAMAVTLRPDAGLFLGGVGMTLVIVELFIKRCERSLIKTLGIVFGKGVVLSLAFALILAPWMIRNWRTFGVVQPLSPAHAEMPGEFVSFGYFRWLRTWVDDSRYTEPMLWNLGDKQIEISSIPATAFDSPEEKQQVAALLDQYNNPPGSHNKPADQSEDDSGDDASPEEDAPDDSADGKNSDEPDAAGQSRDDQDSGDQSSDDSSDDDDENAVVKMTPEIDAEFARIAQERIDRSPSRYYFWTPLKRAGALWFDSHSLYYPFGGQMSKISDLDYDESQQYWLPFFTLLTWIATFAAMAGVGTMSRDPSMRKWLVLLALMTLPRIVFFATLENPEPRYVVELFLFAAIALGIWRGGRRPRRKPRPELSSDRLVSLDVFRGVTIAAMVLVNEPGSWDAIYPQLRHAEWNGATVADWIFPFFLFIVGVSIPYAFAKYRDSDRRLRVYLKVARRTLILFSLGLFLNVFPIYNLWTGAWFDPSHVRIMGVLQRIAICYAIGALVFLHTRWRVQAAIVAVLLLGYSLLMTVVHVPGCEATNAADAACNLAGYVDVAVLGRGHMWSQAQLVDPEGILSTLGAIASTLIGIIVGGRLKTSSVPTPSNDGNGSAPAKDGVARILGAGAALTVLGLIWSVAFPLNKSLWTGSYVLYTAGLATVFLAVLHWLIDIKGWRRWSLPFEIFGTNAIALYVGSSLFGMTLNVVELDLGETTQTLQERIFGTWFLPYSDAMTASLVYAAAFLLLWLLIIALLYRRRIFLKV